MSCEHEIRFTIKPTDDACCFHFDVRAYKDRIVAPDEYSGATEVTPSHVEQVLPTKDKLVRDDITVLPAPTEYLSIDHNGTFTPSSGKVGFSQVDVDVQPDLRPLSVSENGTYEPDEFDGYSDVTVDVEPNLETLSVTENGLYLPESGVDGFDRVSVDVPQPSGSTTITQNGTYNVEQYASAVVDVPTTGYDKGTLIYDGDISTRITQFSVMEMPNGQPFSFDRVVAELYFVGQGGNTAFRTYWRSDLPVTDAQPYMLTLTGGAGYLSGAEGLNVNIDMSSDDTYITSEYFTSASNDASRVKGGAFRIAHDGYQKITAFAWWSYTAQAGGHIKITGYNRTT